MGLYWFNLENIYIGLMFYFGLIGLGSLVFYNLHLLLIQNSKIVLVPKDIHLDILGVLFCD
jgi:hypothetical protein